MPIQGLLLSTRVALSRLQSAEFELKYPQLEGALRHVPMIGGDLIHESGIR